MVCGCSNYSTEPNCTAKNHPDHSEIVTLFWIFACICILVAILSILGNGIVIYVSHETRSIGRLRYLDNVVKSLAVTDFLFGILATPIVITGYFMGKFKMYRNYELLSTIGKQVL